MKLADEYQLKWIRDNFRLKVMYVEKAKHSQSLKLDGLETVVGCHLNELSYLKIWEYDKHGQYTLGVPILFLLYLYVKSFAHYYSLSLHPCVKSYPFFSSLSHLLFYYYMENE